MFNIQNSKIQFSPGPSMEQFDEIANQVKDLNFKVKQLETKIQ
jgi:outer membrane murein-binding lipoprotein Lpp